MRAITVRQPWAQAIVSGVKTVENRSRNIAGSYRGLLVIHAGAQWDRTAFGHSILGSWLSSQWGVSRNNWTGTSLPTGCVLGTVDLTSVHHADDCDPVAEGTCSPWALPGHHHLVLENPRQFADRIPAVGRLGLWTPSAEVLALLPLEDS